MGKTLPRRGAGDGLALWLATVGGIGRLPWAPGTWGSAAGVLIGWWLRRTCGAQALPLWLLAFLGAAWCCGRAERRLGRHDPPSVVLDEAWAMACIVLVLPDLWGWLVAAFLAFRVFDIAKPVPLPDLARLPGGWGIMADDAGAAGYAIIACWLLYRFLR